MPFPIHPKPTPLIPGPLEPLSKEKMSSLLSEGRRLMDVFTAVDQSSADLDRAPGRVKLDSPSHDVAVAEFSGNDSEGRLAFNRNPESERIDRTYEFDGPHNNTVITDDVHTFWGPEQDVWRINNLSGGTLQHWKAPGSP